MAKERVTWKLDDETADLMVAVRKLAAGLGDSGGAVERPTHSTDVLALVDRCRSLFAAIHELLLHRFVHEAVILGRPLFTDSLFLAEYESADETQRVGLVVGWWKASIAPFEGLFRDGVSRGEDWTAQLSQLSKFGGEIETYARRHGARSKTWNPDDHAKHLSLKHGRADEYRTLIVTHLFVHGATASLVTRYSKVSEDTVEVGGPAIDLEGWGRPAGLFAANSMLHAARAGCAIFGWQEPPDIDELFQRIEKASDELDG
jgi:hypothetical protein